MGESLSNGGDVASQDRVIVTWLFCIVQIQHGGIHLETVESTAMARISNDVLPPIIDEEGGDGAMSQSPLCSLEGSDDFGEVWSSFFVLHGLPCAEAQPSIDVEWTGPSVSTDSLISIDGRGVILIFGWVRLVLLLVPASSLPRLMLEPCCQQR